MPEELQSPQGMELQTDAITTVVQQGWSSMLGLDLADGVRPGPDPRERGAMLSFVQFGGAWHGIVLMDCSPELARQLAAGMFGTAPGDLKTEEVHDALGEIVNIIGGNLKQLLPKPCHLSLPAVQEEGGQPVHPVEWRLVSEAGFAFENESFRVALLEGPPVQVENDSERGEVPCKS